MSSERTTSSAKDRAVYASGSADAPTALEWPALAAIAGVALIARLVYVHVAESAGTFSRVVPDSQFLAEQAVSIRLGGGAGPHPYLLSPLYPYFLALFADAKGLDASVVRIVQALVGSASAVLAASIATSVVASIMTSTAASMATSAAASIADSATASLSARRAGWIAGIAAAIYGPLIYFDAELMPVCLQGFCLTLGVAILVRDDRMRERASARHRTLVWALAGLSIGCAAALHSTALAVAVAIIACAWIAKHKSDDSRQLAARSIAFTAAVALAIAPFTIRNARMSGEHVLLSANGGIDFWIGNHAHATGLFETPPDDDFASDPVGHTLAERTLHRQLSYSEASSWWTSRALDDIRADPTRWMRLLREKALLFAHPFEMPRLGDSFERARERAWPLRLPVDARVVMILALAAPLFVALRRGAQSIGALRWPLAALIVHALAMMTFFVSARDRASIVPLAIAVGSIGVVAIFDTLRARVSGATIASLALLAAVSIASFFVYDAPSAPLRIEPLNAVVERQRAASLYAQGRFAEAVEIDRRVLEDADDPPTRTALAHALKALGRFDEAAVEYRRVLAAKPRDGRAWYDYAYLLHTAMRDLRGAEEAYRRAIEYEPSLAEAHFDLGLVLLDLNEPEEAAAAIESSLSLAPENASWRAEAENALFVARTRAGAPRPK
jgi:tetratricopeptide (TPR) repeat protein